MLYKGSTQMDKFSYLNGADGAVIEDLYKQFKENPESVDQEWRLFFLGFDFSQANYDPAPTGDDCIVISTEFKVINLINAYRSRGHLFTRTNPVRVRRKYQPTLDIENFGLTKDDLDREFQAGSEIGIGKAKLSTIIQHLEKTYCESIGVEYRYIRNNEVENWVRSRMEAGQNIPFFSKEEKFLILKSLSKAVLYEKFIHKKFPGQKRFSLEGAESLIPALNAIIEKGARLNIEEFVIGMPHRGRLNVLANIFKKSFHHIFSEFDGKQYEDETLQGDVKYHLGYTSVRKTMIGKDIKLTIAPNPSHLEAVAPVVEGITRGRIDLRYNKNQNKIVPILIHGDASIAGQGVVYEVAQMSELEGYSTGGTIHIVVNNQIGFTTNYLEARSSTYSTDVGKITQSPILHVNGDDVEAVVYSVQFAMEFRNRFNKDIYIDLLCYRKYGHNEGDEPRFTQPILYKVIEKHRNPRDFYLEKLAKEEPEIAKQKDEIDTEFTNLLESNLVASKEIDRAHIENFLETTWKGFRKAVPEDFDSSPDTFIKEDELQYIANRIVALPEDRKFYRKTMKLNKDREKMIQNKTFDWAMGELSAYASLLMEGVNVRISGQDSQRGTFSHRHAVLTVEDSEERYIPLENLDENQAKFSVFNSPLSEYGVLGFEYGYALATPNNLTIWEAQFGDFFNGAQIVLDQYLNSAEDKWGVMNHLVLMLPHGYEGQGPEHSSARIERFMTLCAENNMQLTNVTTPANLFHLLRRQIHRKIRKPLVIFTPKSLLRHPLCVSTFEEFTTGGFKELIDDATADPEKVTKVVMCSGKVYYDIFTEKKRLNRDDVAVVRVEQIYPLPEKQMMRLFEKYSKAKTHLWVQEESINMGPWPYIHDNFDSIGFKVIARPASGSPATGSSRLHAIQQQNILDRIFQV